MSIRHLIAGSALLATASVLNAQTVDQEPEVAAEKITSSGGDREVLHVEHETSPDPFVIDLFERPGQSAAGDNHIVSIGWNSQALDSNEPPADAMGLSFERNYSNPGTAAGFEFHLQTRSVDDVVRRPLSFFLPRDGSAADASGAISITKFNFFDYDMNQVIFMNLAEKFVDFRLGTVIRFGSNNFPIIQQLNASGTAYLPYWFLDNYDNMRGEIPLTIIGRFKDSATGAHSLAAFQGSGARNGSTGLYMLSSTPVDGTFNSFQFAALASVNRAMIENRQSGGSTLLDLMTSGGDSILRHMNTSTGAGYFSGLQASTGDWILQQAAAGFGSGPIVARYLSAQNVFQVGSPLQLMTYNSGALPDPVSVGAGSLAWTAGVDGNGLLVVSDGNRWQTVSTSPSEVSGSPAQAIAGVSSKAELFAPSPAGEATAKSAPRSAQIVVDQTLPVASTEHAHNVSELSERILAQESTQSDLAARIASEATARATADLAIGNQIGELSGRVDSLEARINLSDQHIASATAVAVAMGGNAFLPDMKFNLSANLGTYDGAHAGALQLGAMVSDHMAVNAGVASGFNKGGKTAGRVGVTLGW